MVYPKGLHHGEDDGLRLRLAFVDIQDLFADCGGLLLHIKREVFAQALDLKLETLRFQRVIDRQVDVDPPSDESLRHEEFGRHERSNDHLDGIRVRLANILEVLQVDCLQGIEFILLQDIAVILPLLRLHFVLDHQL